jgi:hypothetical protein
VRGRERSERGEKGGRRKGKTYQEGGQYIFIYIGGWLIDKDMRRRGMRRVLIFLYPRISARYF